MKHVKQIFDENREKKRQLELEKIKITEIKLNEEEKCPLCLEFVNSRMNVQRKREIYFYYV